MGLGRGQGLREGAGRWGYRERLRVPATRGFNACGDAISSLGNNAGTVEKIKDLRLQPRLTPVDALALETRRGSQSPGENRGVKSVCVNGSLKRIPLSEKGVSMDSCSKGTCGLYYKYITIIK